MISPAGVNLTAFASRFNSTWRRRARSPVTAAGTSASTQWLISSPLPCACSASIRHDSSTAARTSKSVGSSSRRPASIFEKSRMSEMIASSASPDAASASTYSSWTGSRSVSRSRLAIPITPFSGVRISWLMLATKSDFSREAASAWSRASTRSFSMRMRSPMSRAIAAPPMSSPSALYTGDTVSATSIRRPFESRRTVSMVATSRFLMRFISVRRSAARSGGTSLLTGAPTISSVA